MGLSESLRGVFSDLLLECGSVNVAIVTLAQALVTVTVETLVHFSLNKSQLSTNTG